MDSSYRDTPSVLGSLQQFQRNNRRLIQKLVLTYGIFSALWIILSDRLLDLLVGNTYLITELQTLKGWFFVLLSCCLLYQVSRMNEQQLLKLYTKRLQAEDALRKTEARYRALVMATTQAVWTTNAQGEVTEDIPTWRKLTGFSYEEVKGWGWLDAVHPDDRAHAAQVWREAVQNRSLYHTEARLKTASGEYRLFEARGVPILDEQGNLTEWVGINVDITDQRRMLQEREQATAALQSSYDLLNAVIEGTADSVFVKDTQGRYVLVNSVVARIIGRPVEEIIGYTDRDFFSPEIADPLIEIDRCVIESGETHIVEEQAPINGVMQTFLSTKTVWRNLDGAVIGLIGIARDITDRKQAEAALRYSEERYRSLITATFQIVWTADAEGNTTSESPTWFELTGQSPDELSPSGWVNYVHPDDRDRVTAAWRHAVATQTTYEVEYRIRAKDGSYRTLWGRGVPVKNADGSTREWVGTCTDITDRRQAEQAQQDFYQELERLVAQRTAELQATQKILETQQQEILKALEQERELGELKSNFIATVSHEFRTPLTIIRSATELLAQYAGQLTLEKRSTYIDRIKRAIETLTQLLDDLLLISQGESGHLSLCPTSIDVAHFCQCLVNELNLTWANHRPIELTYQGQNWVTIDEKLLRIILSNLLSNALKYTPAQQGIWLIVQVNANEVLLQIKDNGIGIPKADQTHLFEPFQRAKNVGKTPGTGLGLSIVRQCVELQNGNLQLESELGTGTTVTITLPLCEPADCSKRVKDEG
jgi:PAS domain S-box-containing protein